jgi:hypothetical protein
MILTDLVEITLASTNTRYYEDKGYIISRIKDKYGNLKVKRGTKIIVKVEDLIENSTTKIKVKCDGCGCEKEVTFSYYNAHSSEEKYFCKKCSKTKSKYLSFEQWCIDNNRLDILDRWDYELNDLKPNEITYGAISSFYFKCPRGIHSSELKNIGIITRNKNCKLICDKCNSFGQYLIDTYGENALNNYWNYEKNNIDPFGIPTHWNDKVYIKCQEKEYHRSYLVSCSNFSSGGNRCPYCNRNSGKVHPLDSLGKLLEDKGLLSLWSNKNKKSPYKINIFSHEEVWWKCPDGIHDDFLRIISNSNLYEFRCPECESSKGEKRINDYLINNNIAYIPQKTYDGLVGLSNGNLSYDFYLPQHNLLIEYQGEFHDGTAKLQTLQELKRQQEHDKRKKEYADDNNIKLLPIWYWDYNNIEEILKNILKIKEAS